MMLFLPRKIGTYYYLIFKPIYLIILAWDIVPVNFIKGSRYEKLDFRFNIEFGFG